MTDSLADQVEKDTDSGRSDSTPKNRRANARKRASAGTRKRGSGSNARSVKKPLEELLATVGTIVTAINPVDGAIILARAEPTARALDDIAKDNPSVHRVLSMLTTGGGGWVGVVTALTPIILPIAHNHGLTAAVPMVDALAAGMMPDEAQAMAGLGDMFAQAEQAAKDAAAGTG